MRNFALLLVVAAVGFLGCGKGGGFDSTEAVGKAFVEAVNAQDKEAVKKLFPTEEVLKATFECKDPEMMKEIAEGRDKLAAELDDDLKGLKMEWKGEKDPKTETVKAGEEKDGCKFKADVMMTRVKWQFTMTKDGKSEDEGEGVNVLKIGDKYYLMGM